ncbi:MAG: NAD(P)/FAD-dependent oxidoreductase [Rikenellaceae bacterium]
MKVAIIGAGAAGFFSAINLKKFNANIDVTIFEGASKVLSKVAVSGGGRCNLTNSFADVRNLSLVYPRGDKFMKRAFKIFDHKDTYEWFEAHGVKLVTQDDNCVFPCSQDSQEIIDTFLRLSKELSISVKTRHKVSNIVKEGDVFELEFDDEAVDNKMFNAVIVTVGGKPNLDGFDMFKSLNLDVVAPVPSLFSFNIANKQLTELMGTVVENAIAKMQGQKIKSTGALLITHWGMSGPAILKLSSYYAKSLNNSNYTAKISINWVNDTNEQNVNKNLDEIFLKNSQKMVTSIRPYNLPSRLWIYLLKKAEISDERRCAELGKNGINRIINILTNDEYDVVGKNRFKEEFVTCGGISLENINFTTMESKEYENLYFAGEVLDVDAITGGFNLQAAWTLSYITALSIATKAKE